MIWEIEWLVHKRDMRGKNHIYGAIRTKDYRYFRIYGECSSANIHMREMFFAYESPKYPTMSNKLREGYKIIDNGSVKNKFPKVVEDIDMQFSLQVLKDER